jgi:hypothetical protein
MKILIEVREYDDYFLYKNYCTGFPGFTSIKKRMTTLGCLAYGSARDTHNDYLLMLSQHARTLHTTEQSIGERQMKNATQFLE